MPTYQPIDPDVPIKASVSDMVAFRWKVNGIEADFVLPADNTRLLRVSFDRQCIVRLLEEMPLSTEDDGPVIGLLKEHFAYRMRNAAFERVQSEAWKVSMHGQPEHYRFVTGWTCMDVVSSAQPLFSIVPRT